MYAKLYREATPIKVPAPRDCCNLKFNKEKAKQREEYMFSSIARVGSSVV